MADTAVRWGGIVLAGGVILLGVGIVMASFTPASAPPSQRTSIFLLVSAILVMLTLPAVYARQANSAGLLGLVGHVLLEVGLVFLLTYSAAPLLYPSLKEPPGESLLALFLGIALVLGLLLFSIATIRAGTFPRLSGVLLLGATIGFFFDFFVAEFLPPIAGQVGAAFFGAVISAGLAWIGISLWMG
jgi:predicted membrane channel-forming protein YqfA (hemolysin III family)